MLMKFGSGKRETEWAFSRAGASLVWMMSLTFLVARFGSASSSYSSYRKHKPSRITLAVTFRFALLDAFLERL